MIWNVRPRLRLSELSGVPCPPQQSGGGTMAAGGAALADGFQFTSYLSSPSSTMRSSAASSIGSIAIAGSVHSTCTSSYYG